MKKYIIIIILMLLPSAAYSQDSLETLQPQFVDHSSVQFSFHLQGGTKGVGPKLAAGYADDFGLIEFRYTTQSTFSIGGGNKKGGDLALLYSYPFRTRGGGFVPAIGIGYFSDYDEIEFVGPAANLRLYIKILGGLHLLLDGFATFDLDSDFTYGGLGFGLGYELIIGD